MSTRYGGSRPQLPGASAATTETGRAEPANGSRLATSPDDPTPSALSAVIVRFRSSHRSRWPLLSSTAPGNHLRREGRPVGFYSGGASSSSASSLLDQVASPGVVRARPRLARLAVSTGLWTACASCKPRRSLLHQPRQLRPEPTPAAPATCRNRHSYRLTSRPEPGTTPSISHRIPDATP